MGNSDRHGPNEVLRSFARSVGLEVLDLDDAGAHSIDDPGAEAADDTDPLMRQIRSSPTVPDDLLSLWPARTSNHKAALVGCCTVDELLRLLRMLRTLRLLKGGF
jgi:hypothetical protein